MPNMVPAMEKVTANLAEMVTVAEDDSSAHQNETPKNLVGLRGFSISRCQRCLRLLKKAAELKVEKPKQYALMT